MGISGGGSGSREAQAGLGVAVTAGAAGAEVCMYILGLVGIPGREAGERHQVRPWWWGLAIRWRGWWMQQGQPSLDIWPAEIDQIYEQRGRER